MVLIAFCCSDFLIIWFSARFPFVPDRFLFFQKKGGSPFLFTSLSLNFLEAAILFGETLLLRRGNLGNATVELLPK